jgi:F-type H+-transporting ATPase subunit delta
MSLPRSYAQALYLAAQERQVTGAALDQLVAQLEDAVVCFQSSQELDRVLTSPLTSVKEKMAIVSALSKKAAYSPLLCDFLALAARKRRLASLPEISLAFAEARLAAEGGVMGTVVSADAVAPADVEELSAAYAKKLGRKVSFRTQVDPELLAGLKVTVQGVTYDGTLRSQLQRLREKLLAGATL